MTTEFLEPIRVLEEDHVFFDAVEHVVLAPHVGEAGLHLVRHVRLHAAARKEPEQRDELDQRDADQQHHVGQRAEPLHRAEGSVPQPRRRFDDGVDGRQAPLPRTDEDGQHEARTTFIRALEAVPRPWIAARRKGLASLPNLLDPPLVVARHSLADEVMQLAGELERDEEEDDAFGFDLAAQGVAPAHDRDIAVLLGDGEPHEGQRG